MESTGIASQGKEVSDVAGQLLEGLEPNEMLAMSSLMRGETVTAAAKAAGVGRTTLYEWLKPGNALHEPMKMWKQDFAGTARTRLLMLSMVATAVVAKALKNDDAKVAMGLLARLGIFAPPVGPAHVETVAEVGRLKSRAARRSEKRVRKALSFTEQWTQFSEETGDEQQVERAGDDAGGGGKAVRSGASDAEVKTILKLTSRQMNDLTPALSVERATRRAELRKKQTDCAMAGDGGMLRLLGEMELEQSRREVARGEGLPDFSTFPDTGYPVGDARVVRMEENDRVMREVVGRVLRLIRAYVKEHPGVGVEECLVGVEELFGGNVERFKG